MISHNERREIVWNEQPHSSLVTLFLKTFSNEKIDIKTLWVSPPNMEAEANCLGGASPPSPKLRAERDSMEIESRAEN